MCTKIAVLALALQRRIRSKTFLRVNVLPKDLHGRAGWCSGNPSGAATFESWPMLIIAQAHASKIGYLVTAHACLLLSYSSFTSHSCRQGQEVSFFFKLPIPVPGPTQPSIQWVPAFFTAGNAAGACC